MKFVKNEGYMGVFNYILEKGLVTRRELIRHFKYCGLNEGIVNGQIHHLLKDNAIIKEYPGVYAYNPKRDDLI
jgi:hypothetical protein